MAVLAAALGGSGLLIALGLWAALRLVVLPLFANVLYYGVVKKRIADAKRRADRVRQLKYLDREGGTSSVAIVVLVLLLFPGVGGVGMLAAIAIPAYQDYIVRAQTVEGFELAEPVQAAFLQAFNATGNVPSDLVAAGLPPDRIEGKYVDSVDLRDGRIDIRYGHEANVRLAGRVVSLTPYEARDGAKTSIVWRCGQAPAPKGATRALADYQPGDLAVDWPAWLPSYCRPRGGVAE
jgi:type IV pilus assembly protein PilA